MLRNTLLRGLVLVLGLWILGSFGPPASTVDSVQASGRDHYGLRTLQGQHGFTYSGSAALGAVASSGRIDFDGRGHLSAVFTTSVGGTAFTGSFTGTYSVNDDGTGSVVIDLPWLGLQAGGDFVIIDKGKGTYFTATDAGYSVAGTTTRM